MKNLFNHEVHEGHEEKTYFFVITIELQPFIRAVL